MASVAGLPFCLKCSSLFNQQKVALVFKNLQIRKWMSIIYNTCSEHSFHLTACSLVESQLNSPCSISDSFSAMCSKSRMMERPARWWKVSFHRSSWTFSSRSRPFRKGLISKATSHFIGFPHSSPDTTALQSPLWWPADPRSDVWTSCGVSAWHSWCPYPSEILQEENIIHKKTYRFTTGCYVISIGLVLDDHQLYCSFKDHKFFNSQNIQTS